jgi:hypothetical protein
LLASSSSSFLVVDESLYRSNISEQLRVIRAVKVDRVDGALGDVRVEDLLAVVVVGQANRVAQVIVGLDWCQRSVLKEFGKELIMKWFLVLQPLFFVTHPCLVRRVKHLERLYPRHPGVHNECVVVVAGLPILGI